MPLKSQQLEMLSPPRVYTSRLYILAKQCLIAALGSDIDVADFMSRATRTTRSICQPPDIRAGVFGFRPGEHRVLGLLGDCLQPRLEAAAMTTKAGARWHPQCTKIDGMQQHRHYKVGQRRNGNTATV
jgi:hypothetical protein